MGLCALSKQLDADALRQIASEIKAFLPFGWQAEWDVQSIRDVGWLCDSRTLFKGVTTISPGHYMMLTDFESAVQHKYWDLDFKDKVSNLVSLRAVADSPSAK